MKLQPIPPFSEDTALAKVKASEGHWNSCDPDRVAQENAANSEWRIRDVFLTGRESIKDFLSQKWKRKLHYKHKSQLWSFSGNHISVRFEYEWQDAQTGEWYRTHGNEHLEFDDSGFISLRDVSANDIPICASNRRIGIKR